MSQHVLRSLLADMKKNDFIVLICDEITDEAHQQHLRKCSLKTEEDFQRLYAIPNADAESLTNLI